MVNESKRLGRVVYRHNSDENGKYKSLELPLSYLDQLGVTMEVLERRTKPNGHAGKPSKLSVISDHTEMVFDEN